MAWSHLQSVSTNSGAASTIAVTFTTANLSSGSKLIAVIGLNAASGTPTTTAVSDGTNNFSQVHAAAGSGLPFPENLSVWVLDTPSGDVGTKPTITATCSGTATSAGLSMVVQEVSGLATGSTLAACCDGSFGDKSSGSSNATVPTYSSTASNEYLFCAITDDGQATLPSMTGFTVDTTPANTNSDIGVAYKNSTGGAESGTWTAGGDSLQTMVAFQLAGAAAPSGGAIPFVPARAFRRRVGPDFRPLPYPQFGSATPPQNLNQTANATVTTTATYNVQVGTVQTSTVTTTPLVTNALGIHKTSTVSTSASVQRGISKKVSATVATSGTVQAVRARLQSLSATVTTTASMVKSISKSLPANVSTSPTVATLLAKGVTLAATVTTTASTVKQIAAKKAATVTTSATVQRGISKTVAATVSTTASLVRGISKTLASTVTTTATVSAIKVRIMTLSATVTTSASMVRSVGKSLAATVTSSSTQTRTIGKSLNANVLTSPAYQRQLAKSLSATVTTTPSVKRGIGKIVVGNVVTVASVATSTIPGGGFDGSVVAWIPYIPDEVAVGQPVTLRVVFAAADGSRPALDTAPTARVFSDTGGTETVLAGPTIMSASGSGWTLTYTPTTSTPQALEVRGKLAGATQFGTFGFTVRPQFDPIALAVSDVIVSRM